MLLARWHADIAQQVVVEVSHGLAGLSLLMTGAHCGEEFVHGRFLFEFGALGAVSMAAFWPFHVATVRPQSRYCVSNAAKWGLLQKSKK